MPENGYDWSTGCAEIKQHSVAKHKLLRAYLTEYFQTLAARPEQEVIKLTIVDGFAGGGKYFHTDTGEIMYGSPVICLECVQEAQIRMNEGKSKPLHFDVDYFFIEEDAAAFAALKHTLENHPLAREVWSKIHLIHGDYLHHAQRIAEFVAKKTPRKGRSIFLLDQYGYSAVPTQVIAQLFTRLPRAEVILTFAVDAFLNYANGEAKMLRSLERIGLPDVLRGRHIDDIKGSSREWRLLIQSTLYHDLIRACGARFYTPFFIRTNRGHGDFWLIHMSSHFKARDVMTKVHWENNNHFIHYGGAGINMFQMMGYDPKKDNAYTGQTLLDFGFDDVARRLSIASLAEQLPISIYATDEGLTFGELFVSTCNSSPATASIYKEALGLLMREQVVDVYGSGGEKRKSHTAITSDDRLVAPRVRSLFVPTAQREG